MERPGGHNKGKHGNRPGPKRSHAIYERKPKTVVDYFKAFRRQFTGELPLVSRPDIFQDNILALKETTDLAEQIFFPGPPFNYSHKLDKMNIEKFREMANITPLSVTVNLGTEDLEMVLIDALNMGSLVGQLFTNPNTGLFFELALIVAKYNEPKAIFLTAWEQLKDLDPAERDLVMNNVSNEFDLENDILEQRIEVLVSILLEIPNNVGNAFDLGSAVVLELKDFKADPIQSIKKILEIAPDLIDEGLEAWEMIFRLWGAIKAFFASQE